MVVQDLKNIRITGSDVRQVTKAMTKGLVDITGQPGWFCCDPDDGTITYHAANGTEKIIKSNAENLFDLIYEITQLLIVR